MASPASDPGERVYLQLQPAEEASEPAVREAQRWIEAVTGRSFGEKDFRGGLDNGILLCELLSSIKPGLVKKINRLQTPVAGLENLSLFLRACEDLGLKGSQLFDPGDLQDTSGHHNNKGSDCSRKLKNVLITIYWLGRAANSSAVYNGPTLDLREFEGLLSQMRKELEDWDSPKRSIRDSGYIDCWESERSDSLSPPRHTREDSFDSLDSLGSRSHHTPSPDGLLARTSSDGRGSDSECDVPHRKLPDMRRDDMLARRTSCSEPRTAVPFNQYLPNKSNQSAYVPTPLRRQRTEKEDSRKSWSNATSPTGGERPFRHAYPKAPPPPSTENHQSELNNTEASDEKEEKRGVASHTYSNNLISGIPRPPTESPSTQLNGSEKLHHQNTNSNISSSSAHSCSEDLYHTSLTTSIIVTGPLSPSPQGSPGPCKKFPPPIPDQVGVASPTADVERDDMWARRQTSPKHGSQSPTHFLPVPSAANQVALILKAESETEKSQRRPSWLDEDLSPTFRQRASVSESMSMIDMRSEDEAILPPHSHVRHELMHGQYSRMKEDESHWQDDLAKWKSRRRSVSQDLIKKEEERKMMEQLLNKEDGCSQRRKSIKTYKEIVEDKERRERELHEEYLRARTPEEAAAVLERYAQRFTISEAVMERLKLPKLLERSVSVDPARLSACPTSPSSPLSPDVFTSSNPLQYLRQQSLPAQKFTSSVEARVPGYGEELEDLRAGSGVTRSGRRAALLAPKPYSQVRATSTSVTSAKRDEMERVNGETDEERGRKERERDGDSLLFYPSPSQSSEEPEAQSSDRYTNQQIHTHTPDSETVRRQSVERADSETVRRQSVERADSETVRRQSVERADSETVRRQSVERADSDTVRRQSVERADSETVRRQSVERADSETVRRQSVEKADSETVRRQSVERTDSETVRRQSVERADSETVRRQSVERADSETVRRQSVERADSETVRRQSVERADSETVRRQSVERADSETVKRQSVERADSETVRRQSVERADSETVRRQSVERADSETVRRQSVGRADSETVRRPSVERADSETVRRQSVERADSEAVRRQSVERADSETVRRQSVERADSETVRRQSVERADSETVRRQSVERADSETVRRQSVERADSETVRRQSVERADSETVRRQSVERADSETVRRQSVERADSETVRRQSVERADSETVRRQSVERADSETVRRQSVERADSEAAPEAQSQEEEEIKREQPPNRPTSLPTPLPVDEDDVPHVRTTSPPRPVQESRTAAGLSESSEETRRRPEPEPAVVSQNGRVQAEEKQTPTQVNTATNQVSKPVLESPQRTAPQLTAASPEQPKPKPICGVSATELAYSAQLTPTSSNPKLRWDFFTSSEPAEKQQGNVSPVVLGLVKRGEHFSWDPEEELKRQERWQREQERMLQEKYQREQEKLKQEWEKAQKEVEEEERKYHEEERKILEETVAPLTPHSPTPPSPCWQEPTSTHTHTHTPSTPTQHSIIRSLADWERKQDELEKQTSTSENKKQRENERHGTAGTSEDISESSGQLSCDSLVSQTNGQREAAEELKQSSEHLQSSQSVSLNSKPHQQQKTSSSDTNKKTQSTSGGRRRSDSIENVGANSSSLADTQQPPPSPNRSVSGKKLCSSCGHPLGKGAAMIIETLSLYFHIQCFKCGICKGQLGDTTTGTDVRIRNGLLNCHQCYIRSRSAGQPTTL